MDEDAHRIIEQLGLSPLPGEGGLFRQSWCAPIAVPPAMLGERYPGPRPLGTAIYYMLVAGTAPISALHRLPGDELWHFYLGDPVQMLLLHPGGAIERPVLGPALVAGQRLQQCVPGGTWQGARLCPGGRWALMGTTMAPGYDPADYEAGAREGLRERFPDAADLITALTPT